MTEVFDTSVFCVHKEIFMKKVYFNIVMTAFLFGTMEVALKLAGNSLDPLQLTFLRFFIGGLLLLPFAIMEIKKKNVKLTIKDFGYLLYLGILATPLSMLCFQLGVMRCNASTAAVLISFNTLFTMLFAHFMTEEKLQKYNAVVLLIGLGGLIFMIKPWNMQEGNTALGIVFMLMAAFFFGWYTVAGKISVKKMGIMAQTSFSFIFGSLVLLVIIVLMGRPVVEGVAENWIVVAYASVFVTGLGYFCYFTAIKYSDATTGSIAFFLKPAIAPIIAIIVLHETVMWNTVVGIALFLLASYINIRGKRNDAQMREVLHEEAIDETIIVD